MPKPQVPPKFSISNASDRAELISLLKVRRQPSINSFIFEQNDKYRHWDELRHFAPSLEGLTIEQLWKLIKFDRMSQYRTIKFGNIELRYNITDKILKTLHGLDRRGGGGIQVQAGFFPSKEQYEKNLINSLMEEAIATSQLEGAATTRRVAKEMLRRGIEPRDESEQMIVNAYRTIRFVREIKDLPLTPELILNLHTRIVEGTLDEKYVGKFRDNDEVVVTDPSGEVLHQPPEHTEVKGLIDELCTFANKEDGEFLHPIIKAIILHFMIGYIHPFENGNGRAARTLFYWYALKKGYWLFEFMPISRVIKKAHGQYSRAYLFAETDDLDITYFIYFNLKQMDFALKDFFEYVARETQEIEKAKEIVNGEGLNFRQIEMVMNFAKHPMKAFTVKEIMNTYKVTYETARSDLISLENLGHCNKERMGRKYYYLYRKKGT